MRSAGGMPPTRRLKDVAAAVESLGSPESNVTSR
jgi:hypothetical protein